MDMDWNKVIARLYNDGRRQAEQADAAIKANQIQGSTSHIIVANVLIGIADALQAGLRYKGN
jgi:flagellin-specific chaperone FliS